MYFSLLMAFFVNSISSQTLERGLTKDEKQLIVDFHNYLRAKVADGNENGQPEASNMLIMNWDDRLERGAQKWADKCIRQHSSAEERQVDQYGHVGQNYAGNFNITSSIKAWYEEHAFYDFTTNSCPREKVCGHYTAFVWWNTMYIGCGWSKCKSTKFPVFFCDYAPGGNIFGRKPYEKGRPCSNCPAGSAFCYQNSLCANVDTCRRSKQQCRCTLQPSKCKHGKFDHSTCECMCQPNWEGVYCEVPCKDTFGEENCQYNIKNRDICSPKSLIYIGGWTHENCRKSCNLCNQITDKKHTNKQEIRGQVPRRMPVQPPVDIYGKKDQEKLTMKQKLQKWGIYNTHTKGSCKNTHKNDKECDLWAGIGQCNVNKDFMQLECAAACNTCEKAAAESQKSNLSNTPHLAPNPNCKNRSPDKHCRIWSVNGQCKSNPDFMTKNCASSCNTC